jgi:hypothetical protein
MNKVYYVMIKGRTLESRDLRELLARAVSEKRNSDRKLRMQVASYRPAALKNPSESFASAHSAAML